MSEFRKKRNSLETFLREQIIGPGAFNKKYFLTEKWDENVFKGMDLKSGNTRALDDFTEVITEVPAYQYSSAILFPETRMPKAGDKNGSEDIVGLESKEKETDEFSPVGDEEINGHGNDDEDSKEDSEGLVSKQQNYPNSIGLSFVINRETNLLKDLDVNFKFRKYNRVEIKECISEKLGCFVSEYDVEIENEINSYFNSIFSTTRKDGNLFIIIKKRLTFQEQHSLDNKLLSDYLNRSIIPLLNEIFKDDIKELNREENEISYGLLKGKTKLFSITKEISKVDRKSQEVIVFKDVVKFIENNLIILLKEELKTDLASYSKYRLLIKNLEIFKQLKSYLTDLVGIYKSKNSSPVWASKAYDGVKLELPKIESGKRVQRFAPRPLIGGDEVKGLMYSVQYLLVKNTNEVFVKIMIENKSPFIINEENPRLNKKDEVNIISFFGVELCVQELRKGILQQYNPPQLRHFDQEDDFNKLIYRKYLDLGEGYNTSVHWGELKDSNKFVRTEFLPEQETPKVDHSPSKVIEEEGIVKSRLTKPGILSMRYLSTLSTSTDAEIIQELEIFVNDYKTWIEDKRKELSLESLSSEKSSLLNSQLEACEKDYKRLLRNIGLLKNDNKGMTAFRVMNTAMFMQLYHGKNKSLSIANHEETFYKKLDLGADKEGSPIDFRWRSFQLAFIILNIDGFIRPDINDKTVDNVFGKPWPERNEVADLVWFPTGGGKTEAYLGLIGFVIAHRRFKNGTKGYGTTVIMRYTLRLLTLQQFQRATLLICAMEVIRKDNFIIPNNYSLGGERITIGLFVGSGSLPNKYVDSRGEDEAGNSMVSEFTKIKNALTDLRPVLTNFPFTNCPWCGKQIFNKKELNNVTHHSLAQPLGINEKLLIGCDNKECTFSGGGRRNSPSDEGNIPFTLFDEDIYKFPPTILFGTVDKFAALANKVSNVTGERNACTRRLFGKGYKLDNLPPELIIQDELHLLLGPLGSSVGLFEKAVDHLCTYKDSDELLIKPKVITSTATTRNTDKQIFALFNRRSEIFPKQGILSDDSFFAFNERDPQRITDYISNRKYVGVLPVGKTQVWMQLRVAAITLAHRLKYIKQFYTVDQILTNPAIINNLLPVFDYYQTTLAYFNSLKAVGKTQSQLSHYLPGDLNFVIKNTIPWSFLDQLMRDNTLIKYSELTGRLNGEEVKTNLENIQKKWSLFNDNGGKKEMNNDNPPEFVIATNMISVGIDVSRFNTMVISSMPRNIAEYIQASSRVARDKEGLVLTVHHPFRSRDISHYQRFKEFHEKFYSYVEPISVTPFANKALERYFSMYLAVMVRHSSSLGLGNNEDARKLDSIKFVEIKKLIENELILVRQSADKLDSYLKTRKVGITSSVEGIFETEEFNDTMIRLDNLLNNWKERILQCGSEDPLHYMINEKPQESLFIASKNELYQEHWKVGNSLREIDPSTVIKTVQQ